MLFFMWPSSDVSKQTQVFDLILPKHAPASFYLASAILLWCDVFTLLLESSESVTMLVLNLNTVSLTDNLTL